MQPSSNFDAWKRWKNFWLFGFKYVCIARHIFVSLGRTFSTFLRAYQSPGEVKGTRSIVSSQTIASQMYKQIGQRNREEQTIEIRNPLEGSHGRLLSISRGKGIIPSGLLVTQLLSYLEVTRWKELDKRQSITESFRLNYPMNCDLLVDPLFFEFLQMLRSFSEMYIFEILTCCISNGEFQ